MNFNEYEAYRSMLAQLNRQAEEMLSKSFALHELSSPEQLRDFLLDAFPSIVTTHGDMAAELAAELYAAQRAKIIDEVFETIVDAGNLEERARASVRSSAKHLFSEKPSTLKMQQQLSGKLYQYINESTSRTIVANALKDSMDVKYARIPRGFETCDFCVMLASRGAVYATPKTAGELNHYHANCKCIVVPSFSRHESLESIQQKEIDAAQA